MSEQTSGEIPANVMADAKPATSTATAPKAPAKAAAKKPAAKKAPAKKAPAKVAAKKPVAKETHIADKIKALPRRRVWPD
ncbi:conserved hypothetical protein [uncultured Thiomicrorhabdus sp.]